MQRLAHLVSPSGTGWKRIQKEEDGQKKVIVHFERPNAEGDFDTARCELPAYHWIIQKGYSEEEICLHEESAPRVR